MVHDDVPELEETIATQAAGQIATAGRSPRYVVGHCPGQEQRFVRTAGMREVAPAFADGDQS